MRSYKYITCFILCLFMYSCLVDQTEEFSGNFDIYTIEGLENVYTKEIGDTLNIPMKVFIEHVTDTSDLEYYWVLTAMATGMNVKDTVSREKDLHFIVSGKFGERVSGQYIVHDTKNDLRYFESFSLYIQSPFKTGWCFLSERNGNGLLTFVASTRENHVYNLSDMNFETPMPKGKYVEFYPSSAGPAIGVVLQDKPEESFFLDGNSLSFVSTLKERFKSLDYVSGEFKPQNMCLEHTVTYSSTIYALVNGKIYARAGYGDINYSYFGAPVAGDYEVGELYGLSGTNSELFVTYDYANHRYIYVPESDVTTIYTYSTPIEDGYPFDISNVDVTPLWMGGSDPAYYRDNQFVAVVKNNDTQKWQLHLFHIKRQREDGVYGYHLQDMELYDFPESMGNLDEYKFCTSNKVLYLGKGNEVYRLSLINFGNIEKLPLTLEGVVTAMDYDSDTSIAVAVDSGENEMCGDVYFISTASENLGDILKVYFHVGGKIVDMVYKNK